ncbi:hypothetical protein SLE2022_194370 [Rubroshorea leprosula]
MDGRRQWLDIQKLGSNGKGHFIFVTSLAPCSGVRLHLWPEKGMQNSDLPPSKKVLEVTSKMVQIPAGPAPRQIEPGSQTEQAPPSAVFQLHPEEMNGFRFLTISVALSASVLTHAWRKELSVYKTQGNYCSQQFAPKPGSPSKENSSSYGQTQEDISHYQHGLLILHLLGALMFVPSLISWLQGTGMHQSFPWFLDSSLCICLILHGILSSEPLFDSSFSLPRVLGREIRLNFIYLIAGLFSYISALALTPYRVFYTMGAIGVISFALSISQQLTGAPRFGRRRHPHKR